MGHIIAIASPHVSRSLEVRIIRYSRVRSLFGTIETPYTRTKE